MNPRRRMVVFLSISLSVISTTKPKFCQFAILQIRRKSNGLSNYHHKISLIDGLTSTELSRLKIPKNKHIYRNTDHGSEYWLRSKLEKNTHTNYYRNAEQTEKS